MLQQMELGQNGGKNMGKKREKANANIVTLIDELIDTKKSALGSGKCPYYTMDVRPCEEHNSRYDCYECVEEYFENMRSRLLKQYIVE